MPVLSSCSVQKALFIPGADLSPAALIVAQVIIAAVMSTGLVSLFTLVIPGLTIIWLSALAYGLLTGFTLVSGIFFALITLLMIFGNVVDQLLMGAKARQSGASWTGVILSTIAAFVFSFLWPPFGGIIAAMLVLFVFEVIRLRDWRKAGGTTKEMAVGCASAVVARFFIGALMISLWVIWVWQSGKLPF
ncbi:MAG: DUF456 domain-containing protein [Anaerolineaceae bacterium]|nr:DUF456 domain-containing protein [Anaerolineaceae bacterium]